MLVLSRKPNEAIVIDGDIRITVVSIRGGHVRLGIEAPDTVGILREELCPRDRPIEESVGCSNPGRRGSAQTRSLSDTSPGRGSSAKRRSSAMATSPGNT